MGAWDVEVYYTGIIGNDLYGALIADELRRRNVNIDYLKTLNGLETTKTFILINKENASRTLFNVLPNITGLKPIDYKIVPDIILMDGEHYSLALDAIEKFPNAIKIIDAGKVTEETGKLCELSDYIICSKEYAELITKERINYKNPDTLKIVLNKLTSMYSG